MSAEGRNLLEVVLNTNIAKKFNEVDESVAKLQKTLETANTSAAKFAKTLKELTDVVNGGEGLNALITKLAQVSVSMKDFGKSAELPANTVAQSSRSMVESVDTVIRAFNKLYSEKLALEKKMANVEISKESKQKLGIDTTNESALAERYKQRLAELNKELDELASKHRDVASSAQKSYETKRLEQQITTEEKRAKVIDQTTRQIEKLNAASEKSAKTQRNSQLGLGLKPQTVEEYRIAIKNLQRQIEQMPISDKSGIAKLNQQITQYKRELDDAIGRTNKFREANTRLYSVLQQVGSAFGIYLGLYGIANFARNVTQVTGEFELQHRALQAIIQDTEAANVLWDKTVRLAVKSPYSVKQLVTYTKQLAAYRVETEKLYDTTKMLADISSGLGVDMQRLILAYGQVKAANYLRGQELRQFSEAGINILGELAKYFEELQGRAITTGEVFEMVSKRMVKFEDVATVLKRLTEEGGIFFNMQEIQAETLKGMLMNLKDSFDIMKNEIGESNRGMIVAAVKAVKYLADNWKDVENVLKGVGGVILGVVVAVKAMRIEMEATAFATKGTAISLTGLSGVIARFRAAALGATTATKGFSTALKSIPVAGWILAALSVLTGLFFSIRGAIKNATEEEKKFNQETEALKTKTIETKAYSDSIIRLTEERKSLTEQENRSEAQEKRLNEIEKEREAELRELIKVNPQYGKTIRDLKDDVDLLKQAEKEELDTLRAILGLRRLMSSNSFKDAAQDFQEASDKLANAEGDLEVRRIEISNYIATIEESGEITSQFLGSFSRNQKALLEQAGTWDRLNNAVVKFSENSEDLSTFNSRYEAFVKELQSILTETTIKLENAGTPIGGIVENFAMATNYMNKVGEAQRNYNEELEATRQEADRLIEGYKQTSEYFNIVDAIENATTEEEKTKARNEFVRFWINFFEENAEIIKPAAKDIISDMLIENVGKTIGVEALTIDEKGEKPFAEWQKKLNKAVKEAAENFNKQREQLSEEARKFLPSIDLYEIKDPEKQLDAARKDILDRLKDVQAEIAAAAVEGQVVISPEQLSALKQEESELLVIKALLGALSSAGRGGNKALELLNKQIDAIKNAANQYKEYKKLFDETEAFDKTRDAVKGIFKELNIGHLLDENGIFDEAVINSEDGLKKWLSASIAAAGKAGNIAAEKYLRELQLKLDQADYQQMLKGFTDEMSEAFDQYQAFKELEKMGIGGDFASSIFGIDNMSLKSLRDVLEEQKEILRSKYKGDDALEEIAKIERKIDEMEEKERIERLKKYTEYLIKGRDEAVRIHLDELTKMGELDQLYHEGKFTEDQRNAIANKIRKETQEALDKLTFSEFKDSSFYTQMFEDMAHSTDRALDIMFDKLDELKTSLSELDPSQVKEIVRQMDKIDEERHNRHPLRYLFKDLQTLRDWDKEGNETLLDKLLGDENELRGKKAALVLEVANLRNQFNELTKDGIEGNESEVQGQLEQKEKELEEINEQLEEIEDNIDDVNNANARGQKAWSDIMVTLQKASDTYNTLASTAKEIAGVVMEMFSDSDEATQKLTEDIANLAASAGALVGDIIQAIASEGTDVKAMADGILQTINIIKYIISISESSQNRIIEQMKNNIESLEWSYEMLEKARKKAWDLQDVKEYQQRMEYIINQQISDYDEMIKAEESRKNKDEDLISDWSRKKVELLDNLQQTQSEFMEQVGGVGSENYSSAAEGFIDAWYDAFKETGSGLEGLKEHFDEILLNLVKKQALMRIANRILEPFFEYLDRLGENGTYSQWEIDKLRALWEQKAVELDNVLKPFFETMGFWGGTMEGDLSGLQKGIQGVTEETAEIIAAYLNSIRFYIIDTNTKIGQLIAAIQDTTGMSNPMLQELRNIKQKTEEIRDFLYQRQEYGDNSLRVFVTNP